MISAIVAIIFLGASASFVKRHKPEAFTSTEPGKLLADVALTLLGAVFVAPVSLVLESINVLYSLGRDCVHANGK